MLRWFIPAVVFASACGDGSATPTFDAAPTVDAGPAVPIRGSVQLLELALDGPGGPNAYASVSAQFFDGERSNYHALVDDDGTCQRWTFTPTFCDPACDQGFCNDGVCIPYPTLVGSGALTITGLTEPLELAPKGDIYYAPAALPTNLFADDATIAATLAGDADGLPALALSTRGTPPLALTISDGKIAMPNGTPHTLRWTPASNDPSARVHVTINANNLGHGSPYLGIIECDVSDGAGQVTIPAAMIDAFPATEAWEACAGSDCPFSHATRYHRDQAAVDGGAVELVVGNRVLFGVDHPAP